MMAEGDLEFGQLLVKLNKATQNQVNKCLELQAKLKAAANGPVPRLGELLVQHGYVDARTVDEILALQRRPSSPSGQPMEPGPTVV
jgi:hypothetical protein